MEQAVAVRNMVCERCVRAVRRVAEEAGLPVSRVGLGELVLGRAATAGELERLGAGLEAEGFGIVEDRKSRLVEEVKRLVQAAVRGERSTGPLKLSAWLAEETGVSYAVLSSLFSQLQGITLEQYAIRQRVERVKELLLYGEHSLTDIAFELGYSSVHHLSTQFRQQTGMTPTAYRAELGRVPRRGLDEV